MCLSLEALVVFLNLLNPAMVSTSDDAILVHATEGTVRWVSVQGQWCTEDSIPPHMLGVAL